MDHATTTRTATRRSSDDEDREKRKKLLSLSHIMTGCGRGNVRESADAAISPRARDVSVNGETAEVVGVMVSVDEGGSDRTAMKDPLYCSYCCKDVTEMNFLIRMKHVKRCSEYMDRRQMGNKENGKPSCVSEESALRYWLKYNGFGDDVFDVMTSRGVRMKEIGRVDPKEAVELIGMKKQKKKMMLAIEQYKQNGCIPLSKSKLNRNTYTKGRNGIGASLKDRFKRFCGEGDRNTKGMQQQRGDGSNDAARVRSADAEYSRQKVGVARQRQIELALCSSLCAVLPRLGDGGSLGNSSVDDTSRDESSMARRYGGLYSKYMIKEKKGKSSLFLASATCSKTGGELSLEQRLEKKRHGANISGPFLVQQQEDGRCKSADASNHEESIKRVRLKALEDELLVQKATVCHLEELIRDLKKEISK